MGLAQMLGSTNIKLRRQCAKRVGAECPFSSHIKWTQEGGYLTRGRDYDFAEKIERFAPQFFDLIQFFAVRSLAQTSERSRNRLLHLV
jgi:hypothetical protein